MSNKRLRKKCQECKKEKVSDAFYKVNNNNMFPDGMINICSVCVRKNVDIDDIQQVIKFLREVDKPYIEKYWDEAVHSGNYPLGEYIRKANSLNQLKNKTFEDSDGYNGYGRIDTFHDAEINEVETVEGEKIEYSVELPQKWGVGYTKEEYLMMEKFYKDMMETHDIVTPTHMDMLRQLAYLSIDRDRLRQKHEWTSYKNISDAMDKMIKSSGFTPADRKSSIEESGMNSFSEIWANIEQDGFIPPKVIDFPKDDIDHMLLYYIQFAQRLVGQSTSNKPPKDWRDEVNTDDNGDESR